MPRSHTIKSIAERAGVASSTVARVLHNSGYVAEATRERVMKAVAGWVNSRMAELTEKEPSR